MQLVSADYVQQDAINVNWLVELSSVLNVVLNIFIMSQIKHVINVLKDAILDVWEKLLHVKMGSVLLDMIKILAPHVYLMKNAQNSIARLATPPQMVIARLVRLDT